MCVSVIPSTNVPNAMTLAIQRYPSGPLIGVAQGLLGLKNSKSLSTLDKASSAFRILKSVLNKVRVRSRYQDKPDRLYVVAGVVVNAGRYEFTLDNGEKTTVAVSLYWCFRFSGPFLSIFFRNTTARHSG